MISPKVRTISRKAYRGLGSAEAVPIKVRIKNEACKLEAFCPAPPLLFSTCRLIFYFYYVFHHLPQPYQVVVPGNREHTLDIENFASWSTSLTTTTMNPAITNLALMLVMMQVSRRLDLEDPDILFYVRIAYLSCQAIAFAVCLYVKFSINKKNDLTTLKYVEPANPMAGQPEPKAVVTTVKEYDLKQIDQQIKGLFTSLAMMGFMHVYMKYTNPLVMQSISSVKGALETNIVKIHLWGKAASGDLERPFKAAPGLLQALQGAGGDVKTDKASIDAAETSGAGGIKEE